MRRNLGLLRFAREFTSPRLVFCCCLAALPAVASDLLLPFGSSWSYRDDGAAFTNNWNSPAYDDSAWKTGPGEFGYGDGDEATVVSFGPDAAHKFITTYFRTWLWIDDPSAYAKLTFSLRRDDGAVIYLNGTELHRSNMPDDDIDAFTYALAALDFPAETNLDVTLYPGSLLVPGPNLIAVEVHQADAASPDLSFDLQVEGTAGTGNPQVNRGPYLQSATSSNIVVRWRTDLPTSSRVRFGTDATTLNRSVLDTTDTTEHELLIQGLAPYTRYYYEVGTASDKLAGDSSYFFMTTPTPGAVQPVRIWAIGDFGTGFPAQYGVRDAYMSFTGSRYTDVWLMLGDNAYYSGLDHEYQAYVFDIYPALLRQSVVWPTVGNHDTDQDMSLSDDFPYYRIFTMPTAGQGGGVPSGTKHYYSFDYANVHFICLDSMTAAYREPDSAMAQWLRADLADTTQDWIVAYWHHPAYSKGSHDSDTEFSMVQMRQNYLPILEQAGVDLVLWGHSHNYERSYLIDGYYGFSGEVNETNWINHGDGRVDGSGVYLKPAGGLGVRRGAVYITDGSSGGQSPGGLLNHPAMYYSSYEAGSVVLDVSGLRLDATFIRNDGATRDHFTIDKSVPSLQIGRLGTNAVISWPSSPASPNYELESRHVLQPADPWTTFSATVVTNKRTKSTIVRSTGTNEFFRLRAP